MKASTISLNRTIFERSNDRIDGDMALNDFFLWITNCEFNNFHPLKKLLITSKTKFSGISTPEWQKCFSDWLKRIKKCINYREEYFEKYFFFFCYARYIKITIILMLIKAVAFITVAYQRLKFYSSKTSIVKAG